MRLQWGRNLSVAEGLARADDNATVHALQWGRNLSVAEGSKRIAQVKNTLTSFNGAATFRLRKEGIYAMRTWQSQCFNGAATFRLRKANIDMRIFLNSGASMGPQPFGCGRGTVLNYIMLENSLQWGRNLSVAEGMQVYLGRTKTRMLQWGRNLSVAEGRPAPEVKGAAA